MLNYIDNLGLRQTIESHLEQANYHKMLSEKIQKKRGKLEFISHDSRVINDACKTLIENCVLAWNWHYLETLVKMNLQIRKGLLK